MEDLNYSSDRPFTQTRPIIGSPEDERSKGFRARRREKTKRDRMEPRGNEKGRKEVRWTCKAAQSSLLLFRRTSQWWRRQSWFAIIKHPPRELRDSEKR